MKFRVTLRRELAQEKTVIVHAANDNQACDLARMRAKSSRLPDWQNVKDPDFRDYEIEKMEELKP
jgi:hypothetical protein